jgi:hypothetical protein
MAFLNVVALSEDTIAAPGNRQPNYICVSVTDAALENAKQLLIQND